MGRALLGIIGWCMVTLARKRPGWKRERERAFRQERGLILVSLLEDAGQTDLAEVARRRVRGEKVGIALVDCDGNVIEVLS